MKKVEEYIQKLRGTKDWNTFLMEESCLPGPRANLELAEAVALSGKEALFLELLCFTHEKAPVNTPQEFIHFCGTLGLGKLISQGKNEYFETLRLLASDPRWRTREAVAMALQTYGEDHMEDLIKEMEKWSEGNHYEKRAAAAALCEPKLLKQEAQASKVLCLLDRITEAMSKEQDRKEESYIALKKGMAYCWSVAVVGNPDEGKSFIEKWFESTDKDIRWIMKENIKKKRLEKIGSQWVELWKERANKL
ncbi:MAG: hypothetical protein PHC92_09635 [Syntrophomonadaceae bacterium]|nr:hypothetical protein [Syntrophomonadaceae bacterium]